MTHVPLPAPEVLSWRVEPESSADAGAVDALVLAAFGPGRFAKTAERLREGGAPAQGFVIRSEGRIIGSVRLWPVRIGEAPALFLGPIAVEAESRREGMGAALVRACLDAADGRGVLLVGDPPYFGRFGFRPAPGAHLPGPVDPRRVMWLGADEPQGAVRVA